MSGLYTAFVSNLLFPLHERLKAHSSVAARKEMEASQWWSRDQLREHQLARLRRLIRRAYSQVPYYRRVMDDLGMVPADIDSLESVAAFRFLTKTEIRAHTGDLKARDTKGLQRSNTGGSSGEPLVFYLGNERVSHDVAAKWRATRWWGVDIGDPEIVIWGSPVELSAQDHLRIWRDRLLRTRLVPAFEMSQDNLNRFIREIRAFRPRMLFGYPSSLALIASHARRTGVRLDDIGARVAFVTSERLYDHQREEIEAGFGCPVANGYGGRDAGFIAHACPDGGMHITDEDILLEIVDPRGRPLPPGAQGEIVVTHFASGDFPFIRYRTGDVGAVSPGECTCGRGLSTLGRLEGRATDFVVARDGTLMHGLALIYIVRNLDGIERFKIVQESLGHTRVFVEPGPGYRDETARQIVSGMKARLGADVQVDVESVARIPAEVSGKFRYVVSKVAGS